MSGVYYSEYGSVHCVDIVWTLSAASGTATIHYLGDLLYIIFSILSLFSCGLFFFYSHRYSGLQLMLPVSLNLFVAKKTYGWEVAEKMILQSSPLPGMFANLVTMRFASTLTHIGFPVIQWTLIFISLGSFVRPVHHVRCSGCAAAEHNFKAHTQFLSF